MYLLISLFFFFLYEGTSNKLLHDHNKNKCVILLNSFLANIDLHPNSHTKRCGILPYQI